MKESNLQKENDWRQRRSMKKQKLLNLDKRDCKVQQYPNGKEDFS